MGWPRKKKDKTVIILERQTTAQLFFANIESG